MQVMIRSGLPLLSRTAGCLQIGLDPQHGILVEGLSAQEEKCLQLLQSPITRQSFFIQADELHIPPERSTSLLRQLESSQVLETITHPAALKPDTHERLLPDATAHTLYSGDGWATLTRRSKASITIHGLGPLGLGTALILANAGIGRLWPCDPHPVRPGDVGRNGYRRVDVGCPRESVVTRLIREVNPEIISDDHSQTLSDLHVVIEHGVADAVTFQPLVHAGVPHLSVVIREGAVFVGPLVRPGHSACTQCLDLHRTDQDPQWPRLASQVAGSRKALCADEETLGAAIGSALAAGQILAEIDGSLPSTVNGNIEIRLPEGVPRIIAWPPHPRCDCNAA